MLLYRDNTNEVVIVGLKDSSGVNDTTATATFSLFDSTNTVVTGLEDVAMTYNGAKHEYEGVIPHTATLPDSYYNLVVTVTSTDSSVGTWKKRLPTRDRT